MGGVGSVGVVVEPPVFDDHAGFEQGVEAPGVEELVAESAVEGLDPGVLPWAAGVDEQRSRCWLKRHQSAMAWATNSGPLSKRTYTGAPRSRTRRSRTATTWSASMRAVDLDRQGFAGELVDHVQHLEGAAVGGGVELEIHRPHHVRSDRAHRPDRDADPGEALLAAPLRHTQAFVAPQAADPFVVHRSGLHGGPSSRHAATPSGAGRWRTRAARRAARPPERHRWREALGGAVDADHGAGPSF